MSSHVFLKVIVFATAFLLINPLVNTKEVMMKLTSPAFTHQAMFNKILVAIDYSTMRRFGL